MVGGHWYDSLSHHIYIYIYILHWIPSSDHTLYLTPEKISPHKKNKKNFYVTPKKIFIPHTIGQPIPTRFLYPHKNFHTTKKIKKNFYVTPLKKTPLFHTPKKHITHKYRSAVQSTTFVTQKTLPLSKALLFVPQKTPKNIKNTKKHQKHHISQDPKKTQKHPFSWGYMLHHVTTCCYMLLHHSKTLQIPCYDSKKFLQSQKKFLQSQKKFYSHYKKNYKKNLYTVRYHKNTKKIKKNKNKKKFYNSKKKFITLQFSWDAQLGRVEKVGTRSWDAQTCSSWDAIMHLNKYLIRDAQTPLVGTRSWDAQLGRVVGTRRKNISTRNKLGRVSWDAYVNKKKNKKKFLYATHKKNIYGGTRWLGRHIPPQKIFICHTKKK